MARARSAYVCQACGGAHPRWLGRCEHCGEWNTLVEDASVPAGTKKTTRSARGVEFISLAGEVAEPSRLVTTLSEVDRVPGGGLVPGSGALGAGATGVGAASFLVAVAGRDREAEGGAR